MSDNGNSIAICDEIEESSQDREEEINLQIRSPYDSAMKFFVRSDYFSEEEDPFIEYIQKDKDVVVIEGSISVSF